MQEGEGLKMARLSRNTNSNSGQENGEYGHKDGYWVCDDNAKTADEYLYEYAYEHVHDHGEAHESMSIKLNRHDTPLSLNLA